MKKGQLGVTYTDHFPVIVELKLPEAEPAGKLPLNWNLNKQGGWKKYEDEGEKVAAKIEEIAEDEESTIEEVMAKVEKVQEKMQYLAFGKIKPETKRAVAKRDKAEKEDSEKAKQLLTRQSDKMEAEILKVKSLKQGRTGSVFKMREVIGGKKKGKQEAHAIKDNETGEMVVSNMEIKRVFLSYCLNILKNNEPKEEVKELVKLKEEVHEMRMLEKENESENEISEEEFFTAVCKFESKKSPMYNFLMKRGFKFRMSIFKVCKRFIQSEEFPSSFNLTTLLQLPKKDHRLIWIIQDLST